MVSVRIFIGNLETKIISHRVFCSRPNFDSCRHVCYVTMQNGFLDMEFTFHFCAEHGYASTLPYNHDSSKSRKNKVKRLHANR